MKIQQKPLRRLVLHTQTIRTLGDRDLRGAVGGASAASLANDFWCKLDKLTDVLTISTTFY